MLLNVFMRLLVFIFEYNDVCPFVCDYASPYVEVRRPAGNGRRVKAICLALSMPVISGVDCWPGATSDECAIVRRINKALRGERLPKDNHAWILMLT